MGTFVITVHIIACVALIVLVLLQSGQEGMGVIFGGSSGTLFGSSGAGGLLSKLTIGAAAVFFVTSLTFTYMNAKNQDVAPESVILQTPAESSKQSPVKNNEVPAQKEQSQENTSE